MSKTKEIKDRCINTRYVDVLDGIRAFAILIIVAFHFWQQCWITPSFQTPFLSFLGIERISFYKFLFTGYEYVDLMILISAFCLFLPHARAMVNGEKTDDIKTFYKKRVARIFPSYYFCVVLIFIMNWVLGNYKDCSTEFILKDLVTHLTFTQMFDINTYSGTLLNTVLWTICIEVMFYLIFPFLAKAFRKFPLITYLSMITASLLYVHAYVIPFRKQEIGFLVNSFPSFLSIFANGMMAAYLFVLIAKILKRGKLLSFISTSLSIIMMYLINNFICGDMIKLYSVDGDITTCQVWQIENRFLMSLLFMIFILSTALAANWFRKIFSNPVVKFIALISMNLYIWHQWLSVLIKYNLRIPAWEGDIPPNTTGDFTWQIEYLVIIIVVSIVFASLITFFVEKPCAKIIMNIPNRKHTAKIEQEMSSLENKAE